MPNPENVSRYPIDYGAVLESPSPKAGQGIRATMKLPPLKWIVVIAALIVSGAVAIDRSAPYYRAKHLCTDNLIDIDYEKLRWANDYHKDSNAIPTWDAVEFTSLFGSGWGPGGFTPPKCPCGGVYTIGRVGELATCSRHGHPITKEAEMKIFKRYGGIF